MKIQKQNNSHRKSVGEIFRFDGKLLKNKFLQKKRAERE